MQGVADDVNALKLAAEVQVEATANLEATIEATATAVAGIQNNINATVKATITDQHKETVGALGTINHKLADMTTVNSGVASGGWVGTVAGAAVVLAAGLAFGWLFIPRPNDASLVRGARAFQDEISTRETTAANGDGKDELTRLRKNATNRMDEKTAAAWTRDVIQRGVKVIRNATR